MAPLPAPELHLSDEEDEMEEKMRRRKKKVRNGKYKPD
jgi:hypothetical protein